MSRVLFVFEMLFYRSYWTNVVEKCDLNLSCFHARCCIYISLQLLVLLFFLASPKILLPSASSVVRLILGYKLLCPVTGTLPIYTAVIHNATVLYNTTNSARFKLIKEGNYSCVATNKYGVDLKKFSVIFTGESLTRKI